MSNTLVVNLFGGPGVSKSTTAALVFGKLKVRGVNAELVTEFAKDLTWEKRHWTLQHQTYIAGKQIFRTMRLFDQVDVIVTDSPILFSLIYKGKDYTPAFEAFLLETFRSWRTLNILLRRNTEVHPYNPKGRNQDEAAAIAIDNAVETMLAEHEIPFTEVPVLPGEHTAARVADLVSVLS